MIYKSCTCTFLDCHTPHSHLQAYFLPNNGNGTVPIIGKLPYLDLALNESYSTSFCNPLFQAFQTSKQSHAVIEQLVKYVVLFRFQFLTRVSIAKLEKGDRGFNRAKFDVLPVSPACDETLKAVTQNLILSKPPPVTQELAHLLPGLRILQNTASVPSSD
jgi:hypothetical protein